MKKTIIMLVLLGMGAFTCYAGMNFKEESLPKRMCIVPRGDIMETFSNSCSSSTATKVRNSNTKRINLTIKNTDGADSIYISTYAATSKSGLYGVGSNTYINETFGDGSPYSGAIYILTEPGQAPVTIRGVEVSYE